MLDDDIYHLLRKKDKNCINTPVEDLFKCGFEALKETNLRYFGLSLYTNPFYMKEKITTNLTKISGGCNGEWIIPDENRTIPQTHLNHFEDVDFCIQYYLRDCGVASLRDWGLKTDLEWWKGTEGGCSDADGGYEKRIATANPNADYMISLYGTNIVKKVEKEWGIELKLNSRHKF